MVTYAYDKDSHVTSLTYGSLGTLMYDYDADGRRTNLGGSLAATTIPAVQTFSYNADNSLKTLGSVTVGNDNDGDITCLTGTSCGEFSYDARGHMGNLTIDALSVTYNYDAFGRRYAVNALFDGNTTTTNYQYDGLNPVAS